MLGINIADVLNVLVSVQTQLIVIGVAIVVALLVTFVVNKRTVKAVASRKLIHSQTWIVAIIAMIVAVGTMMFGPLNTMLSLLSGSGTLTEATSERTKELAIDVEREGIALLQNDDDTLPLSAKKVNVFGWASTNPIYGGTGSGSMNDSYPTTSILQSLSDAGIETNSELSDMYVSYRADRPVISPFVQDWTLPEPTVDAYEGDILSNAKDFSNTAIVVLARSGGEGADLPADMGRMGEYRQSAPEEGAMLGPVSEGTSDGDLPSVYHNNSADYNDFEDGEGYLNLSQTEENLIDMVTDNFDDVIVVYNGANTLNLGFVDEHPQIKSVLWVPPAGQTGFTALGEILAGETNPSGRTADTFVRDFSQTPWANNFGNFQYQNMDEFKFNSSFMGYDLGEITPSFVNYTDGIYVGYKYYETAHTEGTIDYDAVVQYPFGHGLSYTTFTQEMSDVTYEDGKVSFEVTVTNDGDVAGKDTVEVYYNPPYTNGGIEKASANLLDFAKTEMLQPGASQTLEFNFEDEDMASYDDKDAKAYVLEQGDYGISIRSDSHTIIEEQQVTVPETIVYSGDNHRQSDHNAATNEFDDVAGEFETLSRANHFANYATATAAPQSFEMPADTKATFINASNYRNVNDDSDKMPTTGAKNGIRLHQLYGKDYDDPMWDQLLDQLTWNEMDDLIANAGYGTVAIPSIGKVRQSDVDGPSTLNNNFTGVGSIGLPSGVSVANTFNKDLAKQFGEAIGDMAHEMQVTGWYAPAMNIHRSAYAGRNFEYFSEDGVLSGVMAAQQVAGAKEKGVYAFIKHFALNDQETNRAAMLCTWVDEQAMREVYLKPFEIAVKDGGAGGVMTAFNYVGNTYAAGYSPLLKDVLRGEWGFRGIVETDMFGGRALGYQIGDQAMRAGNDAMLATTTTANHMTDHSATGTIAMREATHNILYTAVNSWVYADGEPASPMPIWQIIFWSVVGVLAVILLGCETLAIRRFLSRRKAATVTVEA